MNNLELESIILKHKKSLYQAEKDLLVYNELMADLLDQVQTTSEVDMPALEKMVKSIDGKITSTKLKIQVANKAIKVLGG